MNYQDILDIANNNSNKHIYYVPDHYPCEVMKYNILGKDDGYNIIYLEGHISGKFSIKKDLFDSFSYKNDYFALESEAILHSLIKLQEAINENLKQIDELNSSMQKKQKLMQDRKDYLKSKTSYNPTLE